MIDGAWTMEHAGERLSDRIDLEGPSTRTVRIVLASLSEAYSRAGDRMEFFELRHGKMVGSSV